jgi:hypothetical protein
MPRMLNGKENYGHKVCVSQNWMYFGLLGHPQEYIKTQE